MNTDLKKFETEGYIGPYKIFTEDKCLEILSERYALGFFQTWNKSTHEQSGQIVKTAFNTFIKEKINNLIGKDILLWSSQFIKQKPGQEHGWHLDMELGDGIPIGSWKGVTLWLGLKNLNKKTTLSIITHSHLLQTAPRELLEKKII